MGGGGGYGSKVGVASEDSERVRAEGVLNGDVEWGCKVGGALLAFP